MIKVTLDGNKMESKHKAHQYIKKTLNLPDYYGENLDALWDVLSTYDQYLEVSFINVDKLIAHLGDYGEFIINVFKDASKENDRIGDIIII